MELFAHENMVNYVKKEFADFSEKPFNEVDSMVLCWLSYYRFHLDNSRFTREYGVRLADLNQAEYYDEMMKQVWSAPESIELLRSVAASPRFRNIRMKSFFSEFSEENCTQFAAMTFIGIAGSSYVAFRGTDWTMTGWKEDFRMALKDPIPSQILARDYLNRVAGSVKGGLMVGGHSKGGNLAVYAAACCEQEVRDRIKVVYSHDGPGFLKEVVEENPGFAEIKPLVKKTIPQFSVFGMLLDEPNEYKIIKSHANGVMQHNLINWEVKNGELIKEPRLHPTADLLEDIMTSWLDKIEEKDRAAFIENLFAVIEETGVKTIDEISEDLAKSLHLMLKSVIDQDPETKRFMTHLLSMMVIS